MKILLITTVFKSESVGPARFARLLESIADIEVDILTGDIEESEKVKNVSLDFKWWQKKLKIYFGIKKYQNRLAEVESQYDFLIFNSAILAYKLSTYKPYLVMVNDEKLIGLKPFFKFDYIRRMIHRKAEKSSVLKAEKVVVNSSYLGEKLIEGYGVNESKVFKLLKGISLENKQANYRFRDLSKDESVKLVFIKNDYLIGGLLELIKALAILRNIQFELTIIGPSKSKIKQIDISKNVKINAKGLIPNKEVIEELYNHDILCIPARFEPLGVAVMEGLAVGIPTITTGAGGLHEVTENGKHVWECQPNNPQSIADQIQACINSQKERQSKSESGREYVRGKFNFEKVVNRLKEIIEV